MLKRLGQISDATGQLSFILPHHQAYFSAALLGSCGFCHSSCSRGCSHCRVWKARRARADEEEHSRKHPPHEDCGLGCNIGLVFVGIGHEEAAIKLVTPLLPPISLCLGRRPPMSDARHRQSNALERSSLQSGSRTTPHRPADSSNSVAAASGDKAASTTHGLEDEQDSRHLNRAVIMLKRPMKRSRISAVAQTGSIDSVLICEPARTTPSVVAAPPTTSGDLDGISTTSVPEVMQATEASRNNARATRPRPAAAAESIIAATSVVEQIPGVALPDAVIRAANADFEDTEAAASSLPTAGAMMKSIDAAMAAAGVAPRFAKAATQSALHRLDGLAETQARMHDA